MLPTDSDGNIFCLSSLSPPRHREGFRPRRLRESDGSVDLRHRREHQLGHCGREDAEG